MPRITSVKNGSPTDGRTTMMTWVLPRLKLCARVLGEYRTRSGSLMQRDTVAIDTPAILATSLMDTWVNFSCPESDFDEMPSIIYPVSGVFHRVVMLFECMRWL
jgi:hypothetical protein